MKRRAVLAAIGATGLPTAGCLRVLDRDGQSDSCADGTHFSLQQVTMPHGQTEFSTDVESLPYAPQTLVTHALDSETGESTSRSYYSLHPPKEYVVTESTDFYHVETTDFDTTETTGYEYSVDIGVDGSSLPNTTRIHSFADLPAHDRESLLRAVGDPHLLHAPHYMRSRRNTTSFTAWIRAVTAAIPERFCSKTAYISVSAHWLRPQCSRAPENWRFECPPTLETECAPMRESNNKHRANTRSQSNSESVEVCRPPRGQNNTESPTTIEDRSTGGLALPGDCPRPAPHRFERCAGLGVCKPEIPNAAVRYRGIPPRSRRGGCQTSRIAFDRHICIDHRV